MQNKKKDYIVIAGRQGRQGDTLIRKLAEGEEFPVEGFKLRLVNEELIVALGETTGHYHRLRSTEVDLDTPAIIPVIEIRDEKEALIYKFFKIVAPVDYIHDEHEPITSLTPGNYVAQTQRQYTPKKLERVLD